MKHCNISNVEENFLSYRKASKTGIRKSEDKSKLRRLSGQTMKKLKKDRSLGESPFGKFPLKTMRELWISIFSIYGLPSSKTMCT